MTPDRCRQRARECVELAQTANSARHRTMLLDMAAKWLQLAGMSQQDIDIIAADIALEKKVAPADVVADRSVVAENAIKTCGRATPETERKP